MFEAGKTYIFQAIIFWYGPFFSGHLHVVGPGSFPEFSGHPPGRMARIIARHSCCGRGTCKASPIQEIAGLKALLTWDDTVDG